MRKRYHGKVSLLYSSISSVTGQWSLPKISLRMPQARTWSAIASLTRK